MTIDLSDQILSYSALARIIMKWYHKVAEEFLLGKRILMKTPFEEEYALFILPLQEESCVELMLLQEQAVEFCKSSGCHFLTWLDISTRKQKIEGECEKSLRSVIKMLLTLKAIRKLQNLW